MVMAIGLTVAAPFVSSRGFAAYAQGSQISGYVTGLNRQPLADLNVELMNDYGRMVGRTLTSGRGYYEFNGIRNGRYTVRVYTLGTDYEERENSVELSDPTGNIVRETSDFSLSLRRGVTPASVAVFVQPDVPAEAKRIYEKAIEDLSKKKEAEGLAGLKSALEIFPKYFAALERLGTAYIGMNKPEAFQAAEILLMAAVEVNPRSYKSWYGIAYSRNALKKYTEAMAAVEKAVELNAYSTDALILSGVLLRMSKKFPEAEKHFLKANEISKGTLPRVHLELATLYGYGMKRYNDAARELKAYLKVQPDAKDIEKLKAQIVEWEEKAKGK